ncbi:hypothetical protein POV27_12530 [Aureisphaera galaxeae]|uniref:tetratricopeptide repeat protein n=1 Tax=Aureisphaera galaxeae TaxID=1538023 RepID=UPI00234FEF81|nr:hypothetical protein [Aureisphaera galaxeae]MDC8004880.1 hypothetical protein [Aureisphaera galaxeae]
MPRFSLLILGFFIIPLYGQNPTLDSLKLELRKNLIPEKKIELNKEIGKIYLEGQVYMDSAVFYLHKAEQIAKKKHLKDEVLAETLFRLGHAYGMAKKWEKSLQYFKECAKYAEELNLDNALISAGQNIAKIYMETKQYDLAKDAFIDKIKLAQRLDKPPFILTGYTSLAEIYLEEGNLIKASEYIEKGTQIAMEYDLMGHYYYYTKASVFYAQGDLENAEAVALLAEKAAKKEQDLEYTYEISILLSKIFEDQRRYDTSMGYLKQSIVYHDSIHDAHRLSEVDRMELQLQIQEQEASLVNLKQKNKYLATIYILTALGILLLVVLVLRQRKIVRMTRNIHDIQNSLVKYEIEQRKKMDASAFEATQHADREFLGSRFSEKH